MSAISDRVADYFGGAIAVHAVERPTAPAFLAGDSTVDFAALHRAILAEAATFARAGIAHGTAVALAMRDTPAHIAALFALQRIGAVTVIVTAGDPPLVRDALLAQAGARVAVGSVDDATAWPVPFIAIGEHAGRAGELPAPPGPDDFCGFRRSSGTTGGVPRLTPVTHGYELTQFAFLWASILPSAGDRYLSIVSTGFELGRVSVQHALLAGAAVILPPPLGAVEDLVAVARRQRATWTSITPTHLRHLLGRRPAAPLLPGLSLLTTSSMLTDAERAQVIREVSPDLYVLYATNEAGLLAVASPGDLLRVPGTVGRPVAGIRLEVVDTGGSPVPPGTVGEIRACHPAYPTSYASGDPGSSSRFAEGWFYPGDLGCLDGDGYLFLKGRVDDVINVGGQKVYPAEIVECLTAHPAVVEAAAIGVPERHRGAIPMAAVVLRASVLEEELRRHCDARLGRDRSPARVVPLEALPKTTAGKIDRSALLRQLTHRLAG
ncbi:MAG: class I adenylate-forming enzyme family protein [Alphaproteobacteria bacterium]